MGRVPIPISLGECRGQPRFWRRGYHTVARDATTDVPYSDVNFARLTSVAIASCFHRREEPKRLSPGVCHPEIVTVTRRFIIWRQLSSGNFTSRREICKQEASEEGKKLATCWCLLVACWHHQPPGDCMMLSCTSMIMPGRFNYLLEKVPFE